MSNKKDRTRKKRKRKSVHSREERYRKILGIICLFVSLYLLIAFVSYLFTWKADQDKVLRFSWAIITENNLTVSNWLGRLGALVSNFFLYWGFGFSSLLFVPLFAKLGVDLIRKSSLHSFFNWTRHAIIIMAFLSIVLEFIFQQSSFTWGGVFGSSTTLWLINFIGQIGLSMVLVVILLGFTIWYFNPSFEQVKLTVPGGFIQMPNITLFKVNRQDKDKKSPVLTTLRPGFSRSFNEAVPKTESAGKQAQEAISSGLEFDLPESANSKKKKPKTSPAELEINANSKVDITEKGIDPELLKRKSEDANKLSIESENENHSEPYDPRLELSKYEYPDLEMLEDYSDQKLEIDRAELEANKDQIIETLLNYKIEITKIRATIGPTVTLYEIVPAPGVKISKIKNLEDDIALSLAALGIRIIAPIPGKGTIGIEVPNKKKQIVSLKELIRSDKFQNAKMDLPIALGKTISNEVFVADLAKMPHLLVAGATGQGKSVGINAILISLLYKKHPSQVKLVLIDPKKVELFPYSALDKHFLAFVPNEEESIVTETKKVIYTLNSLCIEMEQRYNLLKKARSRNIKEYNEKFVARKLNPMNGHRFLPFIILVIDEFADLIMTAGKEIELPIARLAQLARAVGIHLIIATQRPSVNIITGVIKANFPARIAYKVTSKIDSRTILDQGGADQLIGRGDMLLSVGGNMVRLQCAFVDTPEVEDVIKDINRQQGFSTPFYLPEYVSDEDKTLSGTNLSLADLDDMFEDAARLVISNQHGSTSMLQRKLQLGYNRAGRIMDQMESLGIVGPAQGSKPREVLFISEYELDNFLNELKNM